MTATLIKEELGEVMNNADKLYFPEESTCKEAVFPNYDGCVKAAREVIQLFIGKSGGEFENLSGNKINPEIDNAAFWKTITIFNTMTVFYQ